MWRESTTVAELTPVTAPNAPPGTKAVESHTQIERERQTERDREREKEREREREKPTHTKTNGTGKMCKKRARTERALGDRAEGAEAVPEHRHPRPAQRQPGPAPRRYRPI